MPRKKSLYWNQSYAAVFQDSWYAIDKIRMNELLQSQYSKACVKLYKNF